MDEDREYFIRHFLRLATIDDWTSWLIGYLENGKKVIDEIDGNFSIFYSFYVAVYDCFFPKPLYGANLINVIVPPGIKVEHAHLPNIGHSAIFDSDYTIYPSEYPFVPLFKDIKKILKREHKIK
jgi:hypothetical protein